MSFCRAAARVDKFDVSCDDRGCFRGSLRGGRRECENAWPSLAAALADALEREALRRAVVETLERASQRGAFPERVVCVRR